MSNLKKQFFVFDYYFHKGKARILTKLWEVFSRLQNIDNIAFFNEVKNFHFSGKIIFGFWNPKIIHLGDQLFYQPIIDFLNKKFEVIVLTYPAMKDYFATLGYKTFGIDEFEREVKGVIFISNEDLLWEMRKNFGKENIFLGINYASPSTPKRVVELIFEVVIKFLQRNNLLEKPIGLKKEDLCPKVSPLLLTKYENDPNLDVFLKNPDKKFLLFNNYVFSNFKGVNKERKKKLESLAKEKKKEGYLICHIGSKKDKIMDKNFYSFVDYDLRGKINPLCLFKIFSLKNVYGIISFDTFVIHTASILKKDLYVVIKGRSSYEKEEKIKKVFVPMASCFENLVKCIF